jgi:hypothetical protein
MTYHKWTLEQMQAATKGILSSQKRAMRIETTGMGRLINDPNRSSSMNLWPFTGAKARCIEFLNSCLPDASQRFTRLGAEVAVPVLAAEWTRLPSAARPSLKEA